MLSCLYTVLFGCLLLFRNIEAQCDYSGDFSQLSCAIETNRNLWKSSAGPNYQVFGFSWSCFCLRCFVLPKDLVVRGRKIRRVTYSSDEDAEECSDLTDETNVLSRDSYETIEGLFDILEDAIDSDAACINVEFDETYGYPISAYIDYNEMIADEERAWTIAGVEP